MAPEIHRCRGDKTKPYDPVKVDVFALGVIFFAIVFNHLPFEYAEETNSLYQLIKDKKFEVFWGHHKSAKLEDQAGFRL